jgi:hypothetical protein
MKMDDVTCSACEVGFRRVELTSEPGAKGEYRCPVCGESWRSSTAARLSPIASRSSHRPGAFESSGWRVQKSDTCMGSLIT